MMSNPHTHIGQAPWMDRWRQRRARESAGVALPRGLADHVPDRQLGDDPRPNTAEVYCATKVIVQPPAPAAPEVWAATMGDRDAVKSISARVPAGWSVALSPDRFIADEVKHLALVKGEVRRLR
jgi:hypothetical protein